MFPFILRGVRLLGIESVYVPMEVRQRIWDLLAMSYKPERLDAMFTEIPLEQVSEVVSELLGGRSRGRWVVNLRA